MCGRYYVDDDTLEEIEKIIRNVDQTVKQQKYNKDIHPTDNAPVLASNGGITTLSIQKWGYPGVMNKGVIFNARAESVTDKRMFHNGITKNRIVIPARLFYEWNQKKEMYTFSRSDGKILYLAGISDRFDNIDRFTIITCAANSSMSFVHDRMPLVLEADQVEEWISDESIALKLLQQIPVLLKHYIEYEQQSLF